MSRRPAVHQILATLGYGDAIGHEVLGIRRALRAAGFDSEIIVETADPRLEDLTVDYRDIVTDVADDDLLIHHFSLGSRASRTAFALPCRMALVYHNITPPEYFLGVHPQLVRQCYHGRRELLAYRTRCDLALGDSEFNRSELERVGFPATGVLPVVPDFTHLDVEGDARVLDAYEDDWTNLLFVGRVIPNKRPDDLIRFFDAYKRLYNRRSRLILAGSYGGFEFYLAQLHGLIGQLGVSDVHILGQVTNEELTSLYDCADVFLCASEHEGFCVPLVERSLDFQSGVDPFSLVINYRKILLGASAYDPFSGVAIFGIPKNAPTIPAGRTPATAVSYDFQETKNVDQAGDNLLPNTAFRDVRIRGVRGPALTWVFPLQRECVAKTERLLVLASDVRKIRAVRFSVDGHRIGSSRNGQSDLYALTWKRGALKRGKHLLRAQVVDTAGKTFAVSRSVRVCK